MLLACLSILGGLTVLVWSADKFVFGAAALARNLGLPPLVIGLTIIAMGSSAPEILVAATAAVNGKPDTAIGNAIGSNITNITLVLGLTALLRPLIVSSTALYREMPMVLLTSLLAGWVLWDARLNSLEGSLLLSLFFVVIGGLCWLAMRHPQPDDPMVAEAQQEVPGDVPTGRAILWLSIGLLLLPLSADWLVDGAVTVAHYFGISDLVIGLTIIAVGTSLPELAACVASVVKREDDLALGNIIGSNIFNILAVLAIPGLLAPGAFDPAAVTRDYRIMLAATVALLLMCFRFRGQRRIGRWEGGGLLLGFVAYQSLLFYNH